MTPIFHITHSNNLQSILRTGGLCCDRLMKGSGLSCVGIAHNHIKDRRARRVVPTSASGTLADYVPFYFAPRSPMLFTISHRNVEQYREGQTPILHLVSSTEAVLGSDLTFAFTDGHAEMAYSGFFEDPVDLDKVDWPLMRSQYWHDTTEDGDRKRRRQAEFLVHRFFPWNLVSKIGVIDTHLASQVEGVLRDAAGVQPKVVVERSWYY